MRVPAALFLLAAAVCAENRDQSLDAEVEAYLDETELNASWKASPQFRSAEGNTRILLRARAMLDAYGASSDQPEGELDNGIFIRQTRLGTVGRLMRDYIYMFEVEFSSGTPSPRDLWLGLRDLVGVARIKFGNMRDPFGLDPVTPIPFHMFLERAVSGRAFGLGRDFAIRAEGAPFDKRFVWMLGWFQERDGWGGAEGSGGYSVSGKVAGLPFRSPDGSHLMSVQFSFAWRVPSEHIARYRARAGPADGPRIVDTGEFPSDDELRFALAFVDRLGPLAFQVEGFFTRNSGRGVDVDFWGVYAMAQWWLTGETYTFHETDAAWGRVFPHANFNDGSGGWGAWAIALRYDHTDLTDAGIDGGIADSWTFDLTWLWNPNMRVRLNLAYADVEGGPRGTGSVAYVMTRFQFDF
jgi:phosphate-selective porin OprO/OprP